ncbi:MAG TPA: hypothetical protein PKA27_06225 [Fimbriimonadaceae bacterium]|nr:hypothetical protein [Fimbriimonadaceae bacterium]
MKTELTEQYRAGLAMLADCIQKCPDELWNSPNPMWDDGDRIIYRPFWRIAFHAVYFTHLYMGQGVEVFQPWPGLKSQRFEALWDGSSDIEPMEYPEDIEPMPKEQMLDYIKWLSEGTEHTIEALDLESPSSGFPWYPKLNKLSHELLNLRHLQGHVGQLSELLIARGIESAWISKG